MGASSCTPPSLLALLPREYQVVVVGADARPTRGRRTTNDLLDRTPKRRGTRGQATAIEKAEYMIVASAGMPVSQTGIILFANPGVEALFGWNCEELLGKAFEHPVQAGLTSEIQLTRKCGGKAVAEMHVVEFTYDSLNRLDLMIQDPEGFSLITDHDYDANGNETKLTDPKGQVVDFEYDELNRLEKKIYHLTAEDFALFTRTHEITFHYDPNNNLTQIDELKSSGTDPPALVSSVKTYDDLDRLESETDVFGKALVLGYDDQGNRTSLTDPDGNITEYRFDALNRLETVTIAGGITTYRYFPDGLKKSVTNPNSTVSMFDYDAADRMTFIQHLGPAGTISAYEYSYDANSNRERQVETNAGRTETTEYTYDFVNRLTAVAYPDRTVAYEYDLAGNRTRELTTGAEASDETFHYDAINRLERITDTASGAELTRYAYDPNGNTRSKTKAGVTTTFLYDIRDQLGEVQQGTSILGRYGYDHDGRRILKIGADGRRHYTYDQLSVITEADEMNATVSKYEFGPDQLLSLNNRNEGRSFFHLDILGSTVNLTQPNGTARQFIFYDAWGIERDRIGSSANNFTFTGHELDQETGLIYAKARFYDPDVGRFLSQDNLVGQAGQPPSLNRYQYGLANPLRFVDSTGFQSESVDGKDEEFDFAAAFRETDSRLAIEGPVSEEGLLSSIVGKYDELKENFKEWAGAKLEAAGRSLFPGLPQTERQRVGQDNLKAFEDLDPNLRAAAEESERKVNLNPEIRETAGELGRKAGELAPEAAEELVLSVGPGILGRGTGGVRAITGTRAAAKPGRFAAAKSAAGLAYRRLKDRIRFGKTARFSNVRPEAGHSFFDVRSLRERGEAIEAALGKNTPIPFRAFDRVDVGGGATSIKSIDLTLPSLQTASGLRGTLRRAVNQVIDFPGQTMKAVTLKAPVSPSRLQIVVQSGKASREQVRIIHEAVEIARSNNIEVIVTTIP